MARAARLTARRRNGLTLLEILVTLVVIVAVFGPILAMTQIGTKRTYRGGDETIATIYATDLVEIVKGAPYDAFFINKVEDKDLSLEDVFKRPIPGGYDASRFDPRFDVRLDVTEAGDLPPSVMKRIRVRVAWKDRTTATDKPRQVVLNTFYGPNS